MPIYLVTIRETVLDKKVLVDANTKAAAINHVTRDLVKAEPLTARDVVSYMQNGAKVEVVASIPVEKEEVQPDLPKVSAEATE